MTPRQWARDYAECPPLDFEAFTAQMAMEATVEGLSAADCMARLDELISGELREGPIEGSDTE